MNTTAPPSPRRQHPLTDRQRQVLRAIYDHLQAHGVAPTYRELLEAIGLPGKSPNNILGLMHRLARKGYLTLPDPEQPVRTRRLCLRGVRMVPVIADDEDGARLRDVLTGTAAEGYPCP